MGRSGIRAAYSTGRGKITVRARTELEEFGQNRQRIIVTELPYQVNKRQLIAAMADPISATRQTATVCASSLSSKRTPTRR